MEPIFFKKNAQSVDRLQNNAPVQLFTHYRSHIFSPTIEAISVVMKKMRQNVAGSRNTRMPISTLPTAPMPVHTGYAVPIGIASVAFASSTALAT